MSELVAVLAGGAIGALLRVACIRSAARPFLWPVLFVNVLGCLVLGFLVALPSLDPWLRLFLTTGFCGAFTTFSTFALEVVELLRTGRPGLAAVYLVATIGLSLLAFRGGLALGA